MTLLCLLLPPEAEDNEVYHPINPTINPHQMSRSSQVHPHALTLWLFMANPITQAHTTEAEGDVMNTHTFGWEKGGLLCSNVSLNQLMNSHGSCDGCNVELVFSLLQAPDFHAITA